MENIELDQLHGELLTRNISKGINNTKLAEENHVLLPSFNKSSYSTVNDKRSKNKLGKSSSMPKYSINDFKVGNQILKQQKQFQYEKNDISRFSLINGNSTQVYEKFRLKRSENPSFTSLNAKNTTMDSILGTTGKKNILNKLNPNASVMMINSMSSIFKNSKLVK